MQQLSSFFFSPNIRFSRAWIFLAVGSLAIAGIFSLPPVFLRSSAFSQIFDIHHIFAVSLVVHVNSSVLIWMLASVGLMISTTISSQYRWLEKIALYFAYVGMLAMTLSAFIPDTTPLKNNYIPVLDNFTFFLGLCAFGIGILIQSVIGCICFITNQDQHNFLRVGIYTSALIFIVAMIGFIVSAALFNPTPDYSRLDTFELLFWGGGHILQFCFATAVMIAWISIFVHDTDISFSPKALRWCFWLNLLLAVPAPLILLFGSLEETKYLFTMHMIIFGGIAPLVIALIMSYNTLTNIQLFKLTTPISCAILSIIMFGYGGVLGYAISGTNASIPAHYHGSIVAISIALMGIMYLMLPASGYQKPQGKIYTAQPWIYFTGQLLHITGLAWMGGYGALRKAPGSSAQVDNLAAKLMFFSGGAIAIIGGLMFVIVCIITIRKLKQK